MNISCDRCHRIKEECLWVQGSSRCARCSRLGFACSNARPVKRVGRRALSAASLHSRREKRITIPVSPSLTETDLVYNVLSQFDIYGKFLIGPTFWGQHHDAIRSYYEQSKPILDNAYLASVLSVAHTMNRTVSLSPEELLTPYRHASLALQTLRDIQVTDTHQAAICLILGTMVMLFAMFKRPQNVYTLSRQTLILLRPVYDTIPSPGPSRFFFLTGTMMLEMLGSLIHGVVPALQFRQPKDTSYVDRYLGLSTSLLPLLFRICELNEVVSTGNGKRDIHGITHSLDKLEAAADTWKPAVPENLYQTFSAIEIAHISCQAQVLRMAALLMIYRLKFPFGMHDHPARAIATSILTQLESSIISKGTPVKFCMIPVLVACVELSDNLERDQWMPHVPKLICCSDGYGFYIQGVIRAYWAIRDSGVYFKGYNVGQYLHDRYK